MNKKISLAFETGSLVGLAKEIRNKRVVAILALLAIFTVLCIAYTKFDPTGRNMAYQIALVGAAIMLGVAYMFARGPFADHDRFVINHHLQYVRKSEAPGFYRLVDSSWKTLEIVPENMVETLRHNLPGIGMGRNLSLHDGVSHIKETLRGWRVEGVVTLEATEVTAEVLWERIEKVLSSENCLRRVSNTDLSATSGICFLVDDALNAVASEIFALLDLDSSQQNEVEVGEYLKTRDQAVRTVVAKLGGRLEFLYSQGIIQSFKGSVEVREDKPENPVQVSYRLSFKSVLEEVPTSTDIASA